MQRREQVRQGIAEGPLAVATVLHPEQGWLGTGETATFQPALVLRRAPPSIERIRHLGVRWVEV
jgi:hypothetical protein